MPDAIATIAINTRRTREPRVALSPGAIAVFARKEVRDALRNRWFIIYGAAFTVLALSLSYVSLGGSGASGFAGFGRTAASLVNLVILIVPLMALTVGAASLAGERERGVLPYLAAQPVTRAEILLGKYLGSALAIIGAIALGFGVSAGVIAIRGGAGQVGSFLALVVGAAALAMAMLSVGALVSACVRRQSVATGIALALWLAFVFLGDLGLMGGALVLGLHAQDLFHLSLINPLQVFKLSALGSVHASLDALGPAGVYAAQEYGRSMGWLLAGALAAWIVAPLALALFIFARRDVS